VAPLKVVKHLVMTPPQTVVKGKQPMQSVQQMFVYQLGAFLGSFIRDMVVIESWEELITMS